MDISAGGYYKWIAKEKSNKELAREGLLAEIQKKHLNADMEPLKSIKALGKNYNIKTVQNVMQENDIIAKLIPILTAEQTDRQ